MKLQPGDYVLLVEAVTEGTKQPGQPVFAYSTVIVHVHDVNDHEPQFLQGEYNVAVVEGQPGGQYVLQVTAIDHDFAENVKISYGIVSGNIDSAFTIDANGVITTNVELDREITPRYTLTVAATDYGVPHKFSITTVIIELIDENDNVPLFPHAENVRISEGTGVGSVVTNVPANDVDLFPSLEYSFADDSNVWRNFAIEKFTGKIVLVKPCDSTLFCNATLDIKVHDGKHSAFMSVTVTAEPKEPAGPHFAQTLYQFTVPVQAVVGTVIGRLTMVGEKNNKRDSVSYKIVSEYPSYDLFSVSRDQGLKSKERST
ncbi:unnamed protein product [Soboliphyme baturini]|uniref:CA domain-containing protein n=1 Tax=Soboliphyme baturini TaxID=241478 RepID=A0A183IV93_9BILA|nr:unnamed protein product [Soboliphyme baturini]